MNLYAERDYAAQDDLGGYHFRHMMAMTEEKLRGKAAIAGELAHRDIEIAKLNREKAALVLALVELSKPRTGYIPDLLVRTRTIAANVLAKAGTLA